MSKRSATSPCTRYTEYQAHSPDPRFEETESTSKFRREVLGVGCNRSFNPLCREVLDIVEEHHEGDPALQVPRSFKGYIHGKKREMPPRRRLHPFAWYAQCALSVGDMRDTPPI